MELETPKDAEIFHEGSHYKEGDKGRSFRWSCGEWILSEKPLHEIRTAIEIGAKRIAEAMDAEEKRAAENENKKAKLKTVRSAFLSVIRSRKDNPPTTMEINSLVMAGEGGDIEDCTTAGIKSALIYHKGRNAKHHPKRRCEILNTRTLTWGPI